MFVSGAITQHKYISAIFVKKIVVNGIAYFVQDPARRSARHHPDENPMNSDNWRKASAPHAAASSLYAIDGHRKYVNRDERARFLEAAEQEDRATHALCLTLAYTGCRITEALSLQIGAIQPNASIIAFRTLKQRGRVVVREVPVPEQVIRALLRGREHDDPEASVWHFGRTFAWQRIKAVMAKAGVVGRPASPRGLRHGFGVLAIQSGVPLNLVQKWLGHANIATTAIYTNAMGPEERAIAERMW